MSRSNTPRPGQTPRPGVRNNENNENNDRPPFYISPVSPPITSRTPPSTPVTPLNEKYFSVMNRVDEKDIKIPIKEYYVKYENKFTREQQALLDSMGDTTKITYLHKHEYPFIEEGSYYSFKSSNNGAFGYTLNKVKELENNRKTINGQQGIIKTYYTKKSAITPQAFHVQIPTAKLVDVDKFPGFQGSVFYDGERQTPYEFDKFIQVETDRIKTFLPPNSVSEGGYRRKKYYKKRLINTKRKGLHKRKTRRRVLTRRA